MMRPPGHYGRAGKEIAARRVTVTEPVPPLSWRWFVPRSRLGIAVMTAVALLMVLIVATSGPSAAAWFGAFGLLQVLAGVATRRMPYAGRLERAMRADPIAAAHLLDARSRVGAVMGTGIASGALVGLAIYALTNLGG